MSIIIAYMNVDLLAFFFKYEKHNFKIFSILTVVL